MSAATALRPGSAPGRAHRFWIAVGAVVGIAVTLALCVYGFNYYTLSSAARIESAKHAALKPSGAIGHGLGIFGGTLLLLMYLYPLRKRWAWLRKKGKTKNWLDCHILMGLTAAVIVTFHSSFKLQGIAGLAYWIMMAVVLSGIVGRYFYSGIPRKLDHAAMSLDEMEQLSANLVAQIRAQDALSPAEVEALLALPSMDDVKAMPLLRALMVMMRLDLRRSFQFWRLRRRVDLRKALAVVRKQASLSKSILFLSQMQRIFHLWHVIHRPFSYSFAILATLHVVVVMFLGYF